MPIRSNHGPREENRVECTALISAWKAHTIWREINGPNLRDNIQPTRERAQLILRKGTGIWWRRFDYGNCSFHPRQSAGADERSRAMSA